jgi:hypothetical protein
MTEGSGITLRNVQLLTKDSNPVMNIHNSQNIVLDRIGYQTNAELLLNVSGEKSKGIKINGTDTKKAKKGIEFTYGASDAAVGKN